MMRRVLHCALFCAFVTPCFSQVTLLDPTFGTDGQVLISLNAFGGDRAEGVTVQPDGRILVAGARGGAQDRMAVLRLLENGALDPSFSGNGIATVGIGVNAEALAIALQPDGRIVLAGDAEFALSFDDLAFARFDPDGELDTTFSNNGVLTISRPGARDAVLALAIQPDGAILGAGKLEGTDLDMVAVRLLANGQLDLGFANGGVYSTGLQTGEVAEDLALRADGRIVLAGAWRLTLPDADLAVLQLTPAGSPDPDFGSDGLFRPSEANSISSAVAIAELNDGRLLIAGRRFPPGGATEEVFTGRVLPDGGWDPSYGIGGRSFLPLGSGYSGEVRDMVVLPDGKALVSVDVLDEVDTAWVMALRVLPDGGPDSTFGVNGRVVMPCPNGDCSVRSLALDQQQRVVAVGSYAASAGRAVMVMRWTPEASTIGMAEARSDAGFKVYPVPTSGTLFAAPPVTTSRSVRIELVDLSGRTLLEFPITRAEVTEFQLPPWLADGRYLLRWITRDRTYARPIVLMR